MSNNTTNVTPWYIRLASTIGRPAVLVGALGMGAPAEIELARVAGFEGFTAYLAPVVLSLYAICAATVATGRKKGDRGWFPSILGAGLALSYAAGAQVVSHLLEAGYISSGAWLVAAVSAIPALACAQLLHLGITPKGEQSPDKDTEKDDATESVNGSETAKEETEAPPPAAPRKTAQKGRPKPSLALIRDAAQNLDATGHKVTAASLAKVMGVSDRTGARYLSRLMAA